MRDAFYEVYDEFIELYDDYFLAAREIGKKFPKYRGTVYVFENFEEFAIYELSEGELWNLVNLDTPYAKILNLKDAIDFDSLGRDIVENLNLKNVFLFGAKVFVLTDLKCTKHDIPRITLLTSYGRCIQTQWHALRAALTIIVEKFVYLLNWKILEFTK